MTYSTDHAPRVCAPALSSGDAVTCLGYAATVMHVYGLTASIRFDSPVRGMSRQLDMLLTSLLPAGQSS